MQQIQADDIADALTFPAMRIKTVYIHPGRVNGAFVTSIGSVTSMEHSADHTLGGGAELSAALLRAKAALERTRATAVQFDTENPLIRAFILRAHLAQTKELSTNARSGRMMDPVLAIGPGEVLAPDYAQRGPAEQWRSGLAKWLPAAGVESVIRLHEERVGIHRLDDSNPEYRPGISATPDGTVVSLLGGREFDWSEWATWQGREVVCGILGSKVYDYPEWTFVQPWHVWFGPPV